MDTFLLAQIHTYDEYNMDYEILNPLIAAWDSLYGISPQDESGSPRTYLFSTRPSMSKRVRFFEKPPKGE
jgi:hypothetical protein